MDDFKRSLDLFNLIQAQQSATNAAVEANDPLIDDGGQWKPIEQVVDFVEDGVDVSWLFTKSTAAFFSEAESVVDPLILVIASEQMDLIRELDFQGHQEADSLK